MSATTTLLPLSFYRRHTTEVAPDLLGRHLWRRLSGDEVAGGVIIEVEAYEGTRDPASHACTRTPRSDIMYGPPGIAYVYFTYGMHHCVNVVCEEEGRAGAVLIRAIEPLKGLEGMAERRGRAALDSGGRVNPRALCSGPARLTQAMAIDLRLNGADLRGSELWISEGDGPLSADLISITPRIGVTRGTRRKARFIMRGNPFLSR